MDNEKHFVLTIAYDGTAYYGWQKTRHGPSIEQTLETVLCSIFQQPISLQAASRTDKGVHAEGQVVDFVAHSDIQPERLTISLNQLLPADIRCLQSYVIAQPFHPTLDATSKTYRYSITAAPVQLPTLRHTHWHIFKALDIPLMDQAAHLCIGTHDFQGFRNVRNNQEQSSTICTISSITIEHKESSIFITMKGNRFLYKMARNIAGSLAWIACGRLSITDLTYVMSSGKRLCEAITAPAHGLALLSVDYSTSTIFAKK